MKITPEEKKLLTQFAGFFGMAIGLPAAPSSAKTAGYIVDKFIESFDANAELMRKPMTRENLEAIAQANYATKFFEGSPWKPVKSCEFRDYPHDHVLCEREPSRA